MNYKDFCDIVDMSPELLDAAGVMVQLFNSNIRKEDNA